MINKLMEAIRSALQGEFGEGMEVSIEDRPDKVQPCFFIQWVDTTSEPSPGKRYFRQNEFCVRYFPEDIDVQQECGAVADRMFWCLEYLTVANDTFRGTNMRCERKDSVLEFFVKYDCFLCRTENAAPMEGAKSEITMKGGD